MKNENSERRIREQNLLQGRRKRQYFKKKFEVGRTIFLKIRAVQYHLFVLS
jgi:hypothetical protein